ncbi:MAG: hypothetical protein AAF676_17450 [Pseudomonadota bacterium]
MPHRTLRFIATAAWASAVLAAPASAFTVSAGASVAIGEGAGPVAGGLNIYTVEVFPGTAELVGFGVTSPDTTRIRIGPSDGSLNGSDAFGLVSIDGAPTFDFWSGWILDQAEWSTFQIVTVDGAVGGGPTLEALFGPWTFGSDVVNWYQIEDARPAQPDALVEGFFFDGTPNSTALAVLRVDQGAVITDRFELLAGGGAGGGGAGGGGASAPVPAPAALPLLVGALGVLGALRARLRA